MKNIQTQVQEDVRRRMTEQLQFSSRATSHQMKTSSDHCENKPDFIVSSSIFGPEVLVMLLSVTIVFDCCVRHVFLQTPHVE